jgi:hypothetical protein
MLSMAHKRNEMYYVGERCAIALFATNLWCSRAAFSSRPLNFSSEIPPAGAVCGGEGKSQVVLTALLWFQNMNAGGSGELCTTHVRFIVEPLSMYKSGAPIISVDGSVEKNKLSGKIVEQEIIELSVGGNQS